MPPIRVDTQELLDQANALRALADQIAAQIDQTQGVYQGMGSGAQGHAGVDSYVDGASATGQWAREQALDLADYLTNRARAFEEAEQQSYTDLGVMEARYPSIFPLGSVTPLPRPTPGESGLPTPEPEGLLPPYLSIPGDFIKKIITLGPPTGQELGSAGPEGLAGAAGPKADSALGPAGEVLAAIGGAAGLAFTIIPPRAKSPGGRIDSSADGASASRSGPEDADSAALGEGTSLAAWWLTTKLSQVFTALAQAGSRRTPGVGSPIPPPIPPWLDHLIPPINARVVDAVLAQAVGPISDIGSTGRAVALTVTGGAGSVATGLGLGKLLFPDARGGQGGATTHTGTGLMLGKATGYAIGGAVGVIGSAWAGGKLPPAGGEDHPIHLLDKYIIGPAARTIRSAYKRTHPPDRVERGMPFFTS